MHLSSLLLLATGSLALPSKRDSRPGSPPPSYSGSVAYFLENNPAGNSIISLHLAGDGSLSQPARTSTAGKGSISVNSTGAPFPSDSLGSQGSVTVAGNLLFTVNAGSNTVSLFAIDPSNPYQPKLIGKPTSTQGQFPISVTYSEKLRKACVLNGGSIAGVTCYSVDPKSGLTIDGPLRKLDSSIINETTPPHGPPGSAAQVLFNPDSSAVFATVKSTSGTIEGSLLVWPIVSGKISTSKPIVNKLKGIALDFGFQFISPTTIFLADPSFGASLLTVKSDFIVAEIAHTVIPGEGAVCWTQYDSSLNSLYTIDAGVNVIHKLNPQNGAIQGTIPVHLPGGNATAGLFDSAIREQKMYSLTAANGIAVVDLKAGKQVQFLDLSKFGKREFYMGMAIWA